MGFLDNVREYAFTIGVLGVPFRRSRKPSIFRFNARMGQGLVLVFLYRSDCEIPIRSSGASIVDLIFSVSRFFKRSNCVWCQIPLLTPCPLQQKVCTSSQYQLTLIFQGVIFCGFRMLCTFVNLTDTIRNKK